MYNLSCTVNVATRTQNSSSTAVNIILVDSTRLNSSSTSLIVNGMSNHDGQFIIINNIVATANLIPLRQRTRDVNNETVMQFDLLLKKETWESVYKSSDTNNKFNSLFFLF
jgi:hypothetical protein